MSFYGRVVDEWRSECICSMKVWRRSYNLPASSEDDYVSYVALPPPRSCLCTASKSDSSKMQDVQSNSRSCMVDETSNDGRTSFTRPWSSLGYGAARVILHAVNPSCRRSNECNMHTNFFPRAGEVPTSNIARSVLPAIWLKQTDTHSH